MTGRLEVICGPDEKRCFRCKQVKPKNEFRKRSLSADGLQHDCKPCANTYARDWHKRHPNHRKDRALRYMYGITLEDRDDLIDRQNGLCAICGGKPNGTHQVLHVDHDKESGEIRGMLCMKCNTAIGNLDHDVDRLRKAVIYLDGKA